MLRLLRFFNGAITISDYEAMSIDLVEQAHSFMDTVLGNKKGSW